MPATARIVTISTLCLLAGAVGLGRFGCSTQSSPATGSAQDATPAHLVMLSPHNEAIRSAFAIEFSNWHRENHARDVEITWVKRGAPECVSYVEDYFKKRRDARPRLVPDLVFGGGVADHNRLAELEYSVPIDISDALKDIPSEVAGIKTRHEISMWHATGLTSFGILFNKRAAAAHGIAPPTTWADLAEPRFYGWIGMADPTVSGSNRYCMMLMFQQYGWDKGWGILTRTLANARALVGTSSKSLDQVSDGVSVAAFAANLDGLARVEVDDKALAYVQPEGGVTITPDILSILTCGKNPVTAERFLRFCLSDVGQELWCVRKDRRTMYQPTLYHTPISTRFYKERREDLAVDWNPVEDKPSLRIDPIASTRQSHLLAPFVSAACGDNHLLLQRTWKRLIDTNMPQAALDALVAPPFDEKEAGRMYDEYQTADAMRAVQMRHEWSQMFRAKYEKVLAMLPVSESVHASIGSASE